MYKFLKFLGNVLYYGLSYIFFSLAWPFISQGIAYIFASIVLIGMLLFLVAYIKVIYYEDWLKRKFGPNDN